MLFIIVCNELRKAMYAFLESKTRPLPFPSLKLAPNDLVPAKPNLSLPSCFTESTCCRKTLYTGGRNCFLQSHAGGQEGRKEASRQSEGDEAMVMVADSITPTKRLREKSPDSE